MIVGLGQRLQRVGNVKIGQKGPKKQGQSGTYRTPQKNDYFTVTTMEKNENDDWVADEIAMGKLGDKPIEIPVFLPSDNIDTVFPTELSAWTASKRLCHGDRQKAEKTHEDGTIEAVACPCPMLENKKCKPHGILNVIIPMAGKLGGVHQFRTTSWNSIENILGSLSLLQSLTGGILAGIPLMLTLTAKKVTPKGGDKMQTIFAVGIEFRVNQGLEGSPVEQLQEASKGQAVARQVAGVDHKQITRQVASLNDDAPEDETDWHDEYTDGEVQQEETSEASGGNSIDDVLPPSEGDQERISQNKQPEPAGETAGFTF